MEKTNKKTTAVEWFMEQCNAKIGIGFRSVMEAEFQQAKAMEREQIEDAFNEAVEEGSTWHIDGEGYFVNRYGGTNG
jgi:hypothetical protein